MALVGVNLHSRPPRARAVRCLRELIQGGQLGSGESLPSEHRLANQFQVSRTTVRAALRQLEGEGVIRSSVDGVRVVADSVRSGSSSVIVESVVVLSQPSHAPVPVGKPQAGLESVIQMGVIDRLKEARVHTLCLYADQIDQDQVGRLVQDGPRGVVALRDAVQSKQGLEILNALRAARVPVVAYGDAPALMSNDTLVSDHEAGSYELTRWLIQRGHKRILCFWQMPNDVDGRPEWISNRGLGYLRAVTEAGLPPVNPLEARSLPNEPTTADEFRMATQLTAGQLMSHLLGDRPVDAIMCVSDTVVASVAAACRLCGREPNRDVAIVGYDGSWSDLPFQQWEPTPPLASVDKGNFAIGRGLANLLLERLGGQLPSEPQHRLIKPRLLVSEPRESK